MTKFRLGDRVKVVKRFDCSGEETNFLGGIGTITNIATVSKGATVYRVNFDDKKTQLLNRYTILYFEDELELLKAEEG